MIPRVHDFEGETAMIEALWMRGFNAVRSAQGQFMETFGETFSNDDAPMLVEMLAEEMIDESLPGEDGYAHVIHNALSAVTWHNQIREVSSDLRMLQQNCQSVEPSVWMMTVYKRT